MRRKDERGHWWTDRGVERTVIRIVRGLSPGWTRRPIARKTRLRADLGWDEWYVLRVAKPVRATLHVDVDERALLALKTVGDLVGSVWGRMAAA